MKNAICAIGITTTFLVGCGNTHGGSRPGGDLSESTSQDLISVQNCITLGRGCIADATTMAAASACEEQVRACLAALVPDAGTVVPPGIPDAATSPIDVVVPPPHVPDAAPPTVVVDAAVPPVSAPDVAVPPVKIPDGGSAQTAAQACLTALGNCLSSSTHPMTCADQARACLEKAL